jgi:hypothetical protein
LPPSNTHPSGDFRHSAIAAESETAAWSRSLNSIDNSTGIEQVSGAGKSTSKAW